MGFASYSHLPAEKGSHAPRPKKNRDTLHNEAWLRAKYLDEALSANQIAAMLGCSQPSVLWALYKFSIPIRSNSESRLGHPNTTEWTSEMRESLAAQRRGAANPAYGQPNARRGDNFDPDPRTAQAQHSRAHRHGMSAPQYKALVAAQGGLCAVCGRPEWKRHQGGTMFTLAVDHNHATGAVRALLCNRCNVTLGFAQEDPALLRALAAYLETHAVP